MCRRFAFCAALAFCCHGSRLRADSMLQADLKRLELPGGVSGATKAAYRDHTCDDRLFRLGMDAMDRMTAAQECGMEHDAIQPNDEDGFKVSDKGKITLCSHECRGREALQKPLPDIGKLKSDCADPSSQQQLDMAAPGYAISKTLWDACPEPITTTSTTGSVNVDCVDRIAELRQDAMQRIVIATEECGAELMQGELGNLRPTPESAVKLCSSECQGKSALGSPMIDISILKQDCTDQSSISGLEMLAPSHGAALSIYASWIDCQYPTNATTLHVEPKEVVDLEVYGLDIVNDLSCGPNTDEYVSHMMNLVYNSVIKIGKQTIPLAMQGVGKKHAHHNYLSCLSSCVVVFTKFSECAEQDDSMKCSGSSYGSSIGPQGRDLAEMDMCDDVPYTKRGAQWLKRTSACRDPRWLQKLKYSQQLPCSAMYGSSQKANSTDAWSSALAGVRRLRIQHFAAKHSIRLAPGSGKSSLWSLDCRNSYCKKVNKASMFKANKAGSLGSCARQCRAWHT